MNRIVDRFAALKSAGRKGFIAYIGAGDPDLAATRALALDVAREALAKPGDTTPLQAAHLVVVCRDGRAIPLLVAMLTRSLAIYRLAVAALVELSGVDSASTWSNPDSLERRSARSFWDHWWTGHHEGFEPVSAAAGQTAVLHWRLRALGLDRATP